MNLSALGDSRFIRANEKEAQGGVTNCSPGALLREVSTRRIAAGSRLVELGWRNPIRSEEFRLKLAVQSSPRFYEPRGPTGSPGRVYSK